MSPEQLFDCPGSPFSFLEVEEKSYIYSKLSPLGSNAPDLNAFPVHFKLDLGTGNLSKFSTPEQFNVLQTLQT